MSDVRTISDLLDGVDISAPVGPNGIVLAAYVILKVLTDEGESVFIESTSDNFPYFEKLGVLQSAQHDMLTKDDGCGCGHD